MLYGFLQPAAVLRNHWNRSTAMAQVMISMNVVSATLRACGGDVESLTPELVIDTLVQDAFMVLHARATTSAAKRCGATASRRRPAASVRA